MILREYSPPRRGGVAIERSALVKGNVSELSRKYGKPSCACAEGQLHRSMVLSWSDQGKTRLMTIPSEKLDRLRANSEGAIRNGLLPCDHQQKDPGKTGGDRPLTFEETRRPAVGLYRQQYLHAFSWSPPVPRLSLYCARWRDGSGLWAEDGLKAVHPDTGDITKVCICPVRFYIICTRKLVQSPDSQRRAITAKRTAALQDMTAISI